MLRHAIEGRMEGKRTRGRKRMMLLVMMKKKKGDNYQHLRDKSLSKNITSMDQTCQLTEHSRRRFHADSQINAGGVCVCVCFTGSF